MNPSGQPEAAKRLSGSGTNRGFYLQRLPREYYQADAVIHWTMPIAMRGAGWLNDAFHAHFREVMLHAAAREGARGENPQSVAAGRESALIK